MKFSIICLVLIGAASAGFSAKGKADIVKVHNDLRSSIANGTYVAKGTRQPAASDMLKMSWDDTIAQCAQTFVDSCPDGHSKFDGYGENMYFAWASDEKASLDLYGVNASKAWEKEFQEKGCLSRTLTKAVYDSGIGHASQMVWSKSNLIGCGVKNCGVDPKNGFTKYTVVCQYMNP
ncbi:hypothetical protein CRE_08781 [Caenorhabditis remanei]|uniref:SCP domain-containing protein n=1 Tax=Caenorhabditis remanei TaxID=31234 RepID=E3LHH4_CAERE|nr:hypothetical protein CRE_08781 [Caenorhabditis remanei]